MNKKKDNKKETKIEGIYSNFTNNLKSLEMFLKSVSPIVSKQDMKAVKNIKKFKKELYKTIIGHKKSNEEEKEGKNKIDKQKAEKIVDEIFNTLKKKPIAGLTILQGEILYKSSFIMLICYFDFLLSDLIRQYYILYPESIYGKDLKLSLSELKDFNYIDDAIDFVIDKEIDRVLFYSLKKQKQYFKESLNIDLKTDLINWGKINEAVERRNIIVHNDSKINKRYLNNIDLSILPKKKKDIKEGEKTKINHEYFSSIFNEIYLSGIILIQNCWRIWIKEEIDLQFAQLNLAIYDFLVRGKWANAERLGLYSKTCRVTTASDRLFLDINYCQSLKWQGKEKELKKELENFDISSLSPLYILAISALKSDKKTFYNTIRKAIVTDKIEKEIFTKWPLFREFREDSDYEKNIEKAFKNVSIEKAN